jgi:hypothetical protein
MPKLCLAHQRRRVFFWTLPLCASAVKILALRSLRLCGEYSDSRRRMLRDDWLRNAGYGIKVGYFMWDLIRWRQYGIQPVG